MKYTKITAVLATLALLGSTAALAADNKELDTRFAAADKNADGKLTLEEAKAGMPRVARAFDKIDQTKQGYITLDQIKTMKASH